MPLTDEDVELLDFDATDYEHYDRAEAERQLEKHGEGFRAQLRIARHLDWWASQTPPADEGGEVQIRTLRDIAAHIRQGDYLPGGFLDGVGA